MHVVSVYTTMWIEMAHLFRCTFFPCIGQCNSIECTEQLVYFSLVYAWYSMELLLCTHLCLLSLLQC